MNLGRGEMRAGRSLDALLAAYRLGARVAWRRLAAAGERAGLSPRTLYTLAEAIFAYIDELSADSIEGYAREQAAAAGALQRRRQRLAAMLVAGPAGGAGNRRGGGRQRRTGGCRAALPCWSWRRDEGGERRGAAAPRSASALTRWSRTSAPFIVALVPSPARTGASWSAAVRDRRAALGPDVSWQEAGVSFTRAREVLRLAERGRHRRRRGAAGGRAPPAVAPARRRPAARARRGRVGPRAARSETELSRERLGSTLDAWLRHRGRTEAVAKALHVHPQTVRYRLARLRELFGTRLDDPDGRFELELALRARRIAG